MSGSVGGKVGAVRVAQAPKSRRCVDGQSLAGDLAELCAGERHAVIREADQALIEGGVPQGREQETVADIEALLIIAIGQGTICDARRSPGSVMPVRGQRRPQ